MFLADTAIQLIGNFETDLELILERKYVVNFI